MSQAHMNSPRGKKMRHPASTERGFTLLESMTALTVLAIGLLGVIAGLLSTATDLRNGQLRQYRNVLIDAKTQALMLTNKGTLPGTLWGQVPQPYPGGATMPNIGIGNGPWITDPSPVIPNDLSTGAYFKVLPDGEITQVTTLGNPACGSAGVPNGTYCREIAIMQGVPPSIAGTTYTIPIPTGTLPYTLWTRVSRGGSPANEAIVQADYFWN
jgi:prepilin-type N-terminal cleavage/methylation domain-containing protein